MNNDELRSIRSNLYLGNLQPVSTGRIGSAQWGEWSEKATITGHAMAAIAVIGVFTRNPHLITAAGVSGGAAAALAYTLKQKADAEKKVEDARKEAARVAEQQRVVAERRSIANEIRDYRGAWEHLDRGETSRNDLGDRMDRIGKIA